MISRNKDIMFLLGAGASAEADIPPSGKMIELIERQLSGRAEWSRHTHLYHHIKSAIHFAAGLEGQFGPSVPYNIETLVNTLYELERNEQHPLYPFIAAWNSRFIALSGNDFKEVKDFRSLILRQLKKWVSPDDTSKSDYYKGLVKVQRDLNFPLRIFSLNYDLCVERLQSRGFRIETGFPGVGPRYSWDWERFEDAEAGPPPPEVYLYKLHGSINWKRDPQTKELFAVEQTESIETEDMEIIFGRDFKLEAADPYLFYAYEFRRFTLATRLIVSIGYGFGDAHINKMLAQALQREKQRRLISVGNYTANEAEGVRSETAAKLQVSREQIIVRVGTAKEYLEGPDLTEELLGSIPKDEAAPF